MVLMEDICSEWFSTPYYSTDAELANKENMTSNYIRCIQQAEKSKLFTADSFGSFLLKNNLKYMEDVIGRIPLDNFLIPTLRLGDQLTIGLLASRKLSVDEKRRALRCLLDKGLDAFNFDHYNTIELLDEKLLNRASAESYIFPIESLPIGYECQKAIQRNDIRTVLDVVQNEMQNKKVGHDITLGQMVIANAIEMFGFFEPILNNLIDFFLMYGTELNLNTDVDHVSLLFLSATECFEDHTIRLSIMERLLKMGADPNTVFEYATDYGEGTLLDYYYESINNEDMYNYCLEGGGNCGLFRHLTTLELKHHKRAEKMILTYGGKNMSDIRDALWYKNKHN